MADVNSGSFYRVADAAQARLLTDPRSVAAFKPFLARECSAGQAAAELGCPLNTLLYRVRTFVRAGLLQVTRAEPRKGRAVKHYRSVHDAYFVPFSLTPYATLEEQLAAQGAPLFRQLVRSYAAAFRGSDRYGRHLLRAPDGAVWTTDLPPDQTPAGLPLVFFDTTTSLNQPGAQALGLDLKTLFARGAEARHQTPDGPAYLLMVALLPVHGSGR